MKKKILALVILVVVIGLVSFVLLRKGPEVETLVEPKVNGPVYQVVGNSVEGRKIEAYTYGAGDSELLFIGGIHGGYEWNSVLLAYRFMDYLDQNTDLIPTNLRVTIIPALNPDGLFKVVGKEGVFSIADVPSEAETFVGRFNANNVDLNRNFDCRWQKDSIWRNQKVSAGTEIFSEPEAKVLRDFVLKNKPEAVVFWHSQANTVYASGCSGEVLPETTKIMNLYAKASGYNSSETFDAYTVTGDAGDWVSSIGIPAITVELQTHQSIEWDKNLKGIKTLIDHYQN